MKKIPSVYSYTKKIVPSYGFLYGTCWEDRENISPLEIEKKTVLGVISPSPNSKSKDKIDKEIVKTNIQTVDSCSLRPEHNTLKVKFSLKFLGNIARPSSCNDFDFYQYIYEQTRKVIKDIDMSVLANAYLNNIFSGKFLWRNALGAPSIEVFLQCDDVVYTKDEHETFTELLTEVLESDDDSYLNCTVEAYAYLGEGQDVYPSQCFPHEQKGKVLYDRYGQAALTSQKINNAIRTIDDWYPDYKDFIGPIPIELYGNYPRMAYAFRAPDTKKDFFSIIKNIEKIEDEEEKLFFLAVLIRGIVLGG